jgi:hypothetical protein
MAEEWKKSRAKTNVTKFESLCARKFGHCANEWKK